MSEPVWLQEAISNLGTAEIAGKANNPAIMQFYRDCGHDEIEFEDTAWCAAFCGAMLKRAGKPTPPVATNLMARSYLKYGTALDKPVPGAIAIWPRGKPPSGHVGIVVSVDEQAGTIRTIEGNASDQVKYRNHKIGEALGYRWPPNTNPIAVAAKSRSVKAQGLSLMAVLASAFEDVRNAIAGAFHFVIPAADYIPGVVEDTQGSINTSQQVASWFNLNLAHVAVYIAIAGLCYAIIRRVLDKREQQT